MIRGVSIKIHVCDFISTMKLSKNFEITSI